MGFKGKVNIQKDVNSNMEWKATKDLQIYETHLEK